MSILYTAKVHVQGGRDGTLRSDDGKLEARLSWPESLGGNGQGTNPEQLFAAGYGACFASTLVVVAKGQGTHLEGVEVSSEVDMIQTAGNYDLAVRLRVHAPGAEREKLEALIEKAKLACPYARAIRNNVVTTVEIGRL